jgi:hypothetical protein
MEFGNDVEGRALGLIIVVSQHLSSGTEENHEILRSFCDRAEIRTENLQERYSCTNMPGATGPVADRIVHTNVCQVLLLIQDTTLSLSLGLLLH